MDSAEILRYYSRPDVQKAFTDFCKDREVVGSFKDGAFSKRPDTLVYSKDLEERVKRGAVAFHASVEHWSNPMQLSSGMNPAELNDIRKGWDMIIDIDSKIGIEHCKIAAKTIYDFLKDNGVTPSIKFSGSRGFHLGIAWNSFPENIDFKPTSSRYPEMPQAVANYIRLNVKDQLLDALIKHEGGVAALVSKVDSISELSPYQFIEIENNWGSRHLFRVPYSLHPKYWLVSIPMKIDGLKNFRLQDHARPDKMNTSIKFLNNKDGEATDLIVKVMDWYSKQSKSEKTYTAKEHKVGALIPEENFPPCIRMILNGLRDGKKRSLFTLIAFLRSVNWDQERIEKRIVEWNQKNNPPLTDRMINTQLRWHFRQNRALMPANCDSDMFYKSLGACMKTIDCGKNPVNHAYNVYFKSFKSKKFKKAKR